MNCPKCLVPLSMSDRQGVEIDFCPQCRGVWLDRGELDKIIERASAVMVPAAAPAAVPPPLPAGPPPDYRRKDRDDDDDDYRRDRDHSYPQYGKKKKKEGFFSDLFDF